MMMMMMKKNIIIKAKKSLLFNGNTAWCKRETKSLFDVTMGSFDGAETCELVGLYLLSKLTPVVGNDIGLYRDDGLAALNKTPREIENIKKYICQTFNEHNLKLTIEANKKTVNFLDVTLDLNSSTYKPYTKPGNVIQYVNRESNHPPSVLRSIPEAINKRLSNISSDKHSFDLAVPPYQEALRKSGYDYKLNYNPQPPKRGKNRSRNITWYNPPFNSNVSTNVEQRFLKIVAECFPPHHTLHKIFNKNTLKISYSSMPNVSSIITAHNKRLLRNETYSATTATCNCRKSVTCPLNGKCQQEGVVYQAVIERQDNKEIQSYIGITEGPFKLRYNNHNYTFRKAKHKNSTSLSKYIWDLKDNDIKFSIKWRVIKRCKAYKSSSKRCNLCLHEKFLIICHPELGTLNSRNELISACRHRKKHLLANF